MSDTRGAEPRGELESRLRGWVEQWREGMSSLEPLRGGAGRRRYWRARFADRSTAIVMHALAENPEILPPGLRQTGEDLPFVLVSRLLARHGFPVPEIHAVKTSERWVLLEDLGGVHLLDLPDDERLERTHEAVTQLARLHALRPEDDLPHGRVFDEEWVSFELRLFCELGLPEKLADELADAFGRLARAVAVLPRTLCHRDFHSQNLMVDPKGNLRWIDYQDALLAPPELDLAALLHDSYIDLGEAERANLLDTYASHFLRPDPSSLALLIVQRKCKDFSRFRDLLRATGETRWARAAGRAERSIRGALPGLPRELRGLGELLHAALEAFST